MQVLERVLAHPALAGARGAIPEDVLAVGGVVRDALLDRPAGPDVDLVVDGDPGPVAESLAARLDGRLTAHPEFRTAEIRRADGHVVDLVGARAERYPEPGALPEVRAGTLAEDLARRDFSINAMALRLAGSEAGTIVDSHDGGADLAAGVIRVLHAVSFTDDPSRVVRATRYGARLGFVLEPDTERLARAAAGAVDPENARVQAELVRLLDEPEVAEGLARLSDLGVGWLVPRGALVPAVGAALEASRQLRVPSEDRAAAILASAADATPEAFGLPGPLDRALRDARAGAQAADALGVGPRLSQVDRLLDGMGAAGAVGALGAGCSLVAEWWPKRGGATLEITGDDLIDAGVAPGPALGRGLMAARAASLDGEAADRGSQLELAVRVAGR